MARSGGISKRLTATAYHEAGHAVACVAYRVPLKGVSIIPDANSLGHCDYQGIEGNFEFGKLTATTRSRLEGRARASLAGYLAEKHFVGRANHRGAEWDRDDALQVASLIYFDPKKLSAYFRQLNIGVLNMITSADRWREIEAVATALLVERTLTHQRTREGIKAAATDILVAK